MPTTDEKIDIDSVQGTAVVVLEHEGRKEAAELLEIGQLCYRMLDTVADIWKQYLSTRAGTNFLDLAAQSVEPVLLVDPLLLGQYTEDVVGTMHKAIAAVLNLEGHRVTPKTKVAPKRVQGDWRTARQQERLSGVSNQAHRQPLDKPHPVKDGLHFRTPEEVLVYDALVALQGSRPKTDTICIAVNAPVRVAGRTFVPDFMVTLRGRVGVIEVDGGTHQKRFLADASRNDLLTDGGFSLVYRIAAEDTARPEEVRAHLDTFIARLLSK
jgi:hypothetical protein